MSGLMLMPPTASRYQIRGVSLLAAADHPSNQKFEVAVFVWMTQKLSNKILIYEVNNGSKQSYGQENLIFMRVLCLEMATALAEAIGVLSSSAEKHTRKLPCPISDLPSVVDARRLSRYVPFRAKGIAGFSCSNTCICCPSIPPRNHMPQCPGSDWRSFPRQPSLNSSSLLAYLLPSLLQQPLLVFNGVRISTRQIAAVNLWNLRSLMINGWLLIINQW